MKLTKQGVRDLNHLKSPKRRKLEVPPTLKEWCKHVRTKTEPLSGDRVCKDCGQAWDWRGQPYDD